MYYNVIFNVLQEPQILVIQLCGDMGGYIGYAGMYAKLCVGYKILLFKNCLIKRDFLMPQNKCQGGNSLSILCEVLRYVSHLLH